MSIMSINIIMTYYYSIQYYNLQDIIKSNFHYDDTDQCLMFQSIDAAFHRRTLKSNSRYICNYISYKPYDNLCINCPINKKYIAGLQLCIFELPTNYWYTYTKETLKLYTINAPDN